jgi:hypothetical protein
MALLPTHSMGRIGRSTREVGPYAALVILLPAGTVIAGLILMVGQRSWFASHARAVAARLFIAALGRMVSGCAGHSASTQAMRPAVTVVTLSSEPLSLTTELPGRVSGGGWEQRAASTHE